MACLNLPLGLLLAVLQRTPAVRVVTAARDYVIASPAGQLLRAAFTVASLGALHSRAGATTFVGPVGIVRGEVGRAIQPVAFTYVGTPSPPARFEWSGTLPPGLNFIPAANGSRINSGTPAITGTPTRPGNYLIFVQGFNAEGLTNNIQQQISFEIEGGAQAIAPTISAHPQSQPVNVGAAVTLSVQAAGSPSPTYQWRRNGNAIVGATNSTLSFPSVQASDAGDYTVLVSNSAGSVPSNVARLTVNTGSSGIPPVITAQPASQIIASGSTVAFSVAATSATSYQWRRNGIDVAGATRATLVLPGATAAQAGTYTVIVGGATGSAPSAGATLTVNPGVDLVRLTNLSIRTEISPSDPSFSLGTVIGGPDTDGTKPLLIRAVGPALAQPAIGIVNAHPDPKLSVRANGVAAGANDDWGGAAALLAAFDQVAAFRFAGPTSKDAAIFNPRAASAGYVIEFSGADGAAGEVIAELYDASATGTVSATTPRLVNVSVLKQIPTDGLLTAGFNVGGGSGAARTVLIRAIGPTLGDAPFFLGGVMSDPKLELFSGANVIASNDNWGGDSQLITVAASVAAFPIANVSSKDAVLLVTLSPGGYTVQVTGVSGGGQVIVELYEIR